MPWCEPCSRYLTLPTLTVEGTCPTCGTKLAEIQGKPRAPWHFWLLVGALSIYLGWRAIQGVAWLLQHAL